MSLRQRVRGVLRKLSSGAAHHGHGHTDAHAHHHVHVSPEEMLAKTDEYNVNAERHWKEIAAEPEGRAHPLNKPFSTVIDTPSILYRLGLVLEALDLGVGHVVLDFGAGTCWLSSCLNRLRIRTIALDVSPTALELGRELFSLDQRHRMDLEPRFLPYDGHRIALPDASVDRIVCFDAFHHVPNQDEVIGEMFRVLRKGGRAVFAEPGEGHSHTGESACEMERCGILEADFHLDDFLEQARKAGFERPFVKPYPDVNVSLDAKQFFEFVGGRNSVFPFRMARQQMKNFAIFGLLKGEPVRDSRHPHAFTAGIQVAEPHRQLRGHGASTHPVAVRLRNTGDTLWRHQLDSVGGYVSLGAFLFDAQGELLSRGLARVGLPHDVAPGESVDVTLLVPLPARPGRYFARLDIVSEWITWGAHHEGSETPEIELVVEEYGDSRNPHQLTAAIERRDAAGEIAVLPGGEIRLPLRITNTGDSLWRHAPGGERGTVAIGGHLHDAAGGFVTRDLFRSPLAADVAPGDSVETVCVFTAPTMPGRYRLDLDLVAEQLLWFVNHGSPVVPVALRVEA